MAILFCNIGWMEHYQGLKKNDQIVGGGTYVKEEGTGHEVCNFSPVGNNLFGYVRPPGQQIKIDRIGANPDDDFVTGVTVIWTASRPTGGKVVVGWYKNATVFRSYQELSNCSAVQRRNRVHRYLVKASANNAVLLPVDERTFEIPKKDKGCMGQANIWYADQPENASLIKRVIKHISGQRSVVTAKRPEKGKQDQERKAQIEKAAIRECCNHFERIGYTVNSVEKDNAGWDLEAWSGKTMLRIEVKGLSGRIFSVELTSNEYQAFLEQSLDYRLAVVLNSLESPELFICRYSNEQKAWVVDGKKIKSLKIMTRQSATIKCDTV